MNYYDVGCARAEAENTLRYADKAVRDAAGLIVNRLRSSEVGEIALKQLKQELKGYNMHTGKWSDK